MIPAHLLVHTVTVEPYQGSGAYGDAFGTAYELPCYVEQEQRIVRDSNGEDAVSSTRLFCNPGESIPGGSRVTWNGRTIRVIGERVFDDGGLTGLAHRELDLE